MNGTKNLSAKDNQTDLHVEKPIKLSDAEGIINYYLKKPLIVNLENLKAVDKQRTIDILTGAVVALGGKICKLDKSLFLLVK